MGSGPAPRPAIAGRSASRNDEGWIAFHEMAFMIPRPLVQRILDRAIEHLQSGFDVALEMDAQRAPAALGQHAEVAAGLSRLDDAEAGLLAGYRQVPGVVGGDLQKDAAVGAAFVGLSGGMQEAWAEFGTGRDVALVAHRQPHALQVLDMRMVTLDIGQQRHIVVGMDARQMSL